MDGALLGHSHAKTPLDVACWDIFAKASDMAVCDLLGGRTDQRLPLISSIPAATPEQMRENVAVHRSNGYLGHSIKIGASEQEGGPHMDADRIKASSDGRLSGEYFIVDANGGLSLEHVLKLLRLLPTELDILLEAPYATWRETSSLRRLTNVPIYLDELVDSDVMGANVVSSGIAEGIGLKISKNGGLTQCRRQRDLCQASGLVMSVKDTVGSAIAFSAIVHLAQTIPAKWLRYILDTRDMVIGETASFDCQLIDGGVVAPKQSGLGVVPNMAVLGQPILSFN